MRIKPSWRWLFGNEQQGLVLLVLFLATVTVQRIFSTRTPLQFAAESRREGQEVGVELTDQPEVTSLILLNPYSELYEAAADLGVRRKSVLHTDAAQRARQDIFYYSVQPADTVVSIARKYSLNPSAILWANYEVLRDDPHRIRPGQSLAILPADGAAYEWHSGDRLESVAVFYNVPLQAILQWRGNRFSATTVEEAETSIRSGTLLFIPGGKREFVTRTVPRISRQNPKEAQIVGEGFCESVDSGPVGSGKWIFPTRSHILDGYDYLPDANHFGIDLKGAEGDPVVAADHGIVVYAGWNEWGYGNLVVIDHGDGWQSLYAHLSGLQVACGDIVFQGDPLGVIGSSGSTDHPNLHFELLHETLGRMNPWDYLPKETKAE